MSVLCTRRYAQEIRRLGPELARFLERSADCFARKDRRAHLAVYVDGQPWERYRVKDGEKGPMVWEAKHAMLICPGGDGLPAETLHLLVASHVLDEDEVKFFVSNAPKDTTVETLLLVGFSRWRVERCFEDQKQEISLDAWEGRRYIGLKRHLILSSVSYLFLARTRLTRREKNPEITLE